MRWKGTASGSFLFERNEVTMPTSIAFRPCPETKRKQASGSTLQRRRHRGARPRSAIAIEALALGQSPAQEGNLVWPRASRLTPLVWGRAWSESRDDCW
jgi:hypothetical protein